MSTSTCRFAHTVFYDAFSHCLVFMNVVPFLKLCLFMFLCSEKCVEVFLHQLCALLKADQYNVSLLSGKGLLDTLLDTLSPLLNSGSERSISKCVGGRG